MECHLKSVWKPSLAPKGSGLGLKNSSATGIQLSQQQRSIALNALTRTIPCHVSLAIISLAQCVSGRRAWSSAWPCWQNCRCGLCIAGMLSHLSSLALWLSISCSVKLQALSGTGHLLLCPFKAQISGTLNKGAIKVAMEQQQLTGTWVLAFISWTGSSAFLL